MNVSRILTASAMEIVLSQPDRDEGLSMKQVLIYRGRCLARACD